VRELEDMQREHARTSDAHDVGQSKHLMDMAAMELSKLKVASLHLIITLNPKPESDAGVQALKSASSSPPFLPSPPLIPACPSRLQCF